MNPTTTLGHPAYMQQTQTRASTVLFAIDIMGNMGAPLRHGFSSSSDQFTTFTDEDDWKTEEEEPTPTQPQLSTYELSSMERDEAADAEHATVVETRRHDTFDHDVGWPVVVDVWSAKFL